MSSQAPSIPTAPFRTHVRVAWSDIDLAGVCYFGHYFRFFEYAEADLFRTTGRSLVEVVKSQNVWLFRVDASCHYRRPALYNDLLEVSVSIHELKTKSYAYHFDVRKDGQDGFVAQGRVSIISVSQNDNRPVALPAAIREILKPYCAWGKVGTDTEIACRAISVSVPTFPN